MTILLIPALEFGWKRVAVRSGVLFVVVFVAESVPNFGPLLNLVGGSAVTLSSVIFPSIFFLYLTAGDKVLDEEGRSAKDFQPKSLKVSEYVYLHSCLRRYQVLIILF